MVDLLWVMFPELRSKPRINLIIDSLSALNNVNCTICLFNEVQLNEVQKERDRLNYVSIDQQNSKNCEYGRNFDRIENKYGVSLRRLVLPEIIQWSGLINPPEKHIQRGMLWCAQYIEKLEDLFSVNNYDYVIIGIGPSIAFRAAQTVSEHYGSELRMMYKSPISKNTAFLFEDDKAKFEDLISFPDKGRVTESDRDSARTIVEEKLKYGEVPRYVNFSSEENYLDRITKSLRKIKPFLQSQNQFRSKRNILLEKLNSSIMRYRMNYSSIESKENKAFFPLHHPIDSQVTLRAPQFINQEILINHISDCLPDDLTLYVKEHPNYIGRYSKRLYRMAKDLDNVKMAPHSINPYQIIEASNVVFTIRSSTGLESIYSGTPVITFCSSFYSGAESVFKVDDLPNLDRQISQSLDSPNHNKENIDFIARLIKAEFRIPYWKKDPNKM